MLVQGMRYMTGSAAFAERSVVENTAKKNLKSPRGAAAASCPITEPLLTTVAEHLLANGFRREIQRLANVLRTKMARNNHRM